MKMVSHSYGYQVEVSCEIINIHESAIGKRKTNSNQQLDGIDYVNLYTIFGTRTNIVHTSRPGITQVARRMARPELWNGRRVPYNRRQVALSIRRTIEGYWPALRERVIYREQLIKWMIDSTVKIVRLVSTENNINNVDLHFQVLVQHNYIVDLSDLIQCKLLMKLESAHVDCIAEILERLSRDVKIELTVSSSSTNNDENCTICLERILDGKNIIWLPCKHLFHGKCIAEWLIERENALYADTASS